METEENIEKKAGRPKRRPKSYEKLLNEHESRKLVETFVMRQLRIIDEMYDLMEPKDKLAFVKDLLPYVMPKFAQVEFKEREDSKTGRWSDQFEAIESRLRKVG